MREIVNLAAASCGSKRKRGRVCREGQGMVIGDSGGSGLSPQLFRVA